jgi:hypothetical protein
VHVINVHAHHSSDTEGEGGLACETRGDSEATLGSRLPFLSGSDRNRGERWAVLQSLSPVSGVSEASSDLCTCFSEPSEDDECTQDLPVTCEDVYSRKSVTLPLRRTSEMLPTPPPQSQMLAPPGLDGFLPLNSPGSDDTERRVDVTLSAAEPQERVSGSGACWTRTSPDVRKAERRYQTMSSSYDAIDHTANQPTCAAVSAIGRQSSPIFGFLRTLKKWPRQNFKGSGVSSDSSQSGEDAEEVGEVLLDEEKWLSGSVLVAGCPPTNWEGAIFFMRPA